MDHFVGFVMHWLINKFMGRSRGEGQEFGPLPPPLEKSQVAIGSLEILVRTPLKKQLDPLGPIASRGRFVWPSVKYADE